MKTRVVGFELDPRTVRTWQMLVDLKVLRAPPSPELREQLLGWVDNAIRYKDGPPAVLDVRMLCSIAQHSRSGCGLEPIVSPGDGVMFGARIFARDPNYRLLVARHQDGARAILRISFWNLEQDLVERLTEELDLDPSVLLWQRSDGGSDVRNFDTRHGRVGVIYETKLD
jgi:hypothetical protein